MNKRRELLMAGIPTGDARAFMRVGKMNPALYLDLGGNDSGPAPDPNPNMEAAADASSGVGAAQLALAQDYLAFSKEQYADLKPYLEKVADSELSMMQSNQKRADDYANYERDTFRPVEKQLVQQAQDYNTDANRERLASQGMADVREAYDQQRKQALDTLSRYGINPNSARFASLNAQLAQSEAADSAGVANRARTAAEDKGRAMMYDAVNLGKGLASNATQAYGVAGTAGNSSAAIKASPLDFSRAAYGTAGNLLTGSNQSFGTSGAIYGNEFNARMSGYNAQQQNQDNGLGAMLGFGARILAAPATGGGSIASSLFLADGGETKRSALHTGQGEVRGPGGPVDDKVPAMLSNGEFVLPADTVERVGKGNLEKLIAQTHVPAAVQRKQALSKRG